MRKLILIISLILITIITKAQVVAYWPLDGDAIDISGNGNDGIINGAISVSDVNGISNRALYFTSGTEIEFTNSDPYNLDINELSVSFWMKSQTYNANLERWFNKFSCNYLSDPGSSWFIFMQNGKFGLHYFMEGGLVKTWYSSKTYNDNQWHHVVVVFRGSKIEFYKDGMLDVSYTPSNHIIKNTGFEFTISHSGCGITNGTLDEVKIFNYAISNTDIQQIYAEGVPIVIPPADQISGSNTVCLGDIDVEYSVPAIEGATGYVWELPEGATISSGENTENIKVNFSSSAVSGNISVYGTNNEYFGASSNLEIHVGEPASAGAINGINFVSPDDTVTYSISEVDGATDYEWELSGIATIISGANTNSIDVKFLSSSGIIKVTPVNNCGSGKSSSLMVTVGDITTSGPIIINPFSADKNYLLYKTNVTNLGIIGSDAKLYSGGNSDNFGVYVFGDHNLEFSTNNTKRLVITGSGNVGIGITDPGSYKLNVAGNFNLSGDLYKNGELMKFGIWEENGLNIYYNTGNVGIGTSTPQSNLDIVSSTSPVFKIRTTGSDTNYIPKIELTGIAQIGSIGEITFINSERDCDALPDAAIIAYSGSAINTADLRFFTASQGTFTQKMIITDLGNVGIGTTSPNFLLDIKASVVNQDLFRLDHSISPTTDGFTLGFGNIFGSDDDAIVGKVEYSDVTYSSFAIKRSNRNFIFLTGNVGIGTTNPGSFKLAVEGKIGAREVIVTNDVWADFVFEPEYNLMSLKDLETYIKANKHLPEIPTTDEVKENGIAIGEMNAKLLQKIEELTLYTIKQQELIDALIIRVEQIENRTK